MDDLKIEREMFKALSLLHSTDESSGKNLRLMLDSLIEEKFGFQKTVTSRISKAILTKAESCGISGKFFFFSNFKIIQKKKKLFFYRNCKKKFVAKKLRKSFQIIFKNIIYLIQSLKNK